MLHTEEIRIAILNAKTIANINIDEGILKALEVYQLVKDYDDTKILADLCKFLGALYLKNDDHIESKKSYLEAIKYFTLEKNLQQLANVYNNLIIISFYTGDHDLIDNYKDLAIQFYFDAGDNSGAISVLNNVALYYSKINKYDKATITFEKLLIQYKPKLTIKECLLIKANLSNSILLTGENINEALLQLETLLEEAKKLEYFHVVVVIYKHLADFFESIEDYKNAYTFLKLKHKYISQANLGEFNERIQTHMNSLNDVLNDIELKKEKQKNQELAEKHTKVSQRNGMLEALLETIPLPLYHTDIEGRLIGCNKAFLDYGRVDFKDIYNKRLCDIIHSDVEKYNAGLREALSTKKPLFKEKTLKVNGKERHFNEYKNVFYGSDTKIEGIVTLFNEITEQKNTQLELKDSKDKLEAIFNNAQIGILVLDTELNFTFMNPYIIKNLGYTKNHIKQHGVNLIKDKCSSLIETITANFENGLFNEPVESCIEINNGNIMFIRTESTRICDDNGNITSYLLLIKNITEEKENKQKVLSLNAHLKSIMESAENIYIASIDTEGKFTYFNNNYYNSVKRNMNFEVEVGADYYARYENEQEKQKRKKKLARVFNGEYINGTRHYDETDNLKEQDLQYYYSPIIDENQEIIGATIFSYDITDRVLAQRQLALASSTKDKFFSIIAHDLRSPIGNIKALLEYIMADDEISHEELMQMLKQLTDTACNTFDLLENLLKWASNQKGSLSITPEQTQIKDVLESVFKLTINLAANKNIRIIADIPNEAQAYIDKDMIKTVVRNLISNAIKYTPKNGKITIEVTQDPYYCTVRITDTGVGIKEEVIPYLTQLDRTVSTYGTEGEKGSGLGIVLSNELIEKMHGKFWIESEEGVGSTFSFTVPTDISSY